MWQANAEVLVTALDDELVLMHPTSNQMFSLNPSGRLVWQALPRTEAALAGLLTAQYDLSPEQAGQDVHALLLDLQNRQLAFLT
ncbi:PqqD family protein [Deinococcus alpinitundrae]|uniref:PqqD family protein n=1 Tax=Deinococcus alpinitundrae TaxID=468913 RepID=UPI001379AF9B|nr:PqqD family protein [Deinococcus alpinitundrae]